MSDTYSQPDLLVDTAWVQDHMDDPEVRIVDCDEYPVYRRAHIPGSVGLQVFHYIKHQDYPDNPLVMPPEPFADLMRKLGIGNDTLVIAYDGFGSLYATRFWWVLNYYGHTNVKVLNGGWNKWIDEGRPSTYQVPRTVPTDFAIPESNSDMNCTLRYGLSRVGNSNTVFLDTRSSGERDGSNDRGNMRVGYVPGSIHLEWLNFVTNDGQRTFKPAAELHSMLEQQGITPDKEVIPY